MFKFALLPATLLATGLTVSSAHAAGSLTLLPYTPYSVNATGTAAAGDDINLNSVWMWTTTGGVQNIGGVSSINPGAGIAVISADGSRIAGATLDSATGTRSASVYNVATGQWTALAGLGGYSATPGTPAQNATNFLSTGSVWAMSSDGTFVAGQSYQVGNGTTNSRATIWNTQTGTVTNLGNNPGITSGPNARTRVNGISDNGRVAGGFGANSTPLVWTDFDGDGSYATVSINAVSGAGSVNAVNAVSANGQWAVGSGFINSASGSAYRFNTSTNQLSFLGQLTAGVVGAATAVNADGSVIVGYEGSGGASTRRGFIWTTAGGMQSFDDYLAGFGIDTANSFNFATPIGISADGRSIVGFGYANGSQVAQGFLVNISAVPEPGTYAMFGLGLLLMAARRSRRAD